MTRRMIAELYTWARAHVPDADRSVRAPRGVRPSMGSAIRDRGRPRDRPRPHASAPSSRSSTSAAPPSPGCPARGSSTSGRRPTRQRSRRSPRTCTTSASGRSRARTRGRRPGRCTSGAIELDGEEFRIHFHVQPRGTGDLDKDLRFRDALRADPELRDGYARIKSGIAGPDGGPVDAVRYQAEKGDWILEVFDRLGIPRPVNVQGGPVGEAGAPAGTSNA